MLESIPKDIFWLILDQVEINLRRHSVQPY
jgi:hypothetical protein